MRNDICQIFLPLVIIFRSVVYTTPAYAIYLRGFKLKRFVHLRLPTNDNYNCLIYADVLEYPEASPGIKDFLIVLVHTS